MKKVWNALFGSGKSFAGYRAYDRRDNIPYLYSLGRTGVMPRAMDETRPSPPKTGEFPLGD